ncbi:MAG: CAP domain-containing protein [Urechidicola sp.]|nr:CAP domain-containing protein [Urechidicola sp.]
MKTITQNILLVAFASFMFFSCATDDSEEFIQSEKIVDIQLTYTSLESEITTLINEYRSSNGLSTLNVMNIVSFEAETHTEYMVRVGEVNHDNFNERYQYLVANANAKSASENVAYGYNSAESVVNAWLNSPSHKEIISNPSFTDFGISTKIDSDGKYYYTNIFIKK